MEMNAEKIDYPIIDRNMSLKITLCYLATLCHPLEKIDPINSLIYNFPEITSVINSNNNNNNNELTKFLYFNKNNIHNILFDNEERINLNQNQQNTSISFLFYLSLLINDNPDIVFYLYSFNYIQEINTMQENSDNLFEKIII